MAPFDTWTELQVSRQHAENQVQKSSGAEVVKQGQA